ncbi:PEK protein kinase [Polytolypa hystricis UAMH7299]|uniref:PEK protein kinase n=1 Tax=Polytolypa hystricis (strain UAMH7299) TaxID=1447883 RepID=A0A2B7YSW9_POLH7|nr:PEK protein kinase [Polytolypa hystricis UAMH7299]
MSLFRSPEEISSSDPESDSEDIESERDDPPQTPHDPKHNGNASLSRDGKTESVDEVSTSKAGDSGEIPDLDAEGHSAMMTAALLEFYCLSRAADTLNEQPGSHGRYTRDSPEARFLGRRLYAFKSRFLSSHGVIADGIDGEDWGTARQYYRDSLDTIGSLAVDNLDLNIKSSRPPSRGVIKESSETWDFNALQKQLEERELKSVALLSAQKRPAIYQRRITDGAAPFGPENFAPNFASLVPLSQPTLPRLPMDIPQLPPNSLPSSVVISRYATEFEEEAMIGKGSYGAVYRAKHHVDGQMYAIKKIPLSPKRLKKLQDGGLKELDNILKEIRTLARLEHINVVRYFGAWAEYSQLSEPAPQETFEANRGRMGAGRQALLSQPSFTNGNEMSFGVVFEEASNGIIFEESSRSTSTAGEGELSPNTTRQKRETHAAAKASSFRRSFVESHSDTDDNDEDVDDDDDDEVESIPRPFSFPSNGQTSSLEGSDEDIFSDGRSVSKSGQVGYKKDVDAQEPMLTLHIQMSLHPLSLAKYLNPQTKGTNTSSPRHCFHLIPSLRILLGILAGVDYLHATGIVHRDLKPANIFLSPKQATDDTTCPTCGNSDHTRQSYTIPRIGDFGLVAEISNFDEDQRTHDSSFGGTTSIHDRPVGTEFYRPPIFIPQQNGRCGNSPHGRNERGSPSRNNSCAPRIPSSYLHRIDESLDVYALGVILFELLYKLETRMERQMVLCGLTCSPNGWTSRQQKDMSDKQLRLQPLLPVDFTAKIDGANIPLADGRGSIADLLAKCICGMLEPDPELRWSSRNVRNCLEGIFREIERGTK